MKFTKRNTSLPDIWQVPVALHTAQHLDLLSLFFLLGEFRPDGQIGSTKICIE